MKKRKTQSESSTSIAGVFLILLILFSVAALVFLFVKIYVFPDKAPAFVASSGKVPAETKTTSDTVVPPDTENKDFPEGTYSDLGAGTFYISTQSGTSEDGNTPFELISSDTTVSQIGFGSSGMDGSKITYIYIDGMLNTKEQLSDSQGSLDLTGDLLKAGTYKVEAVQFEGDEPSGTIVTYKSASYEIKN